jgi:hypothetical protein
MNMKRGFSGTSIFARFVALGTLTTSIACERSSSYMYDQISTNLGTKQDDDG